MNSSKEAINQLMNGEVVAFRASIQDALKERATEVIELRKREFGASLFAAKAGDTKE